MEFLTELWLPILLTAVALQIASTICWVVLPHHHGDFRKSANEDELMDSVRKLNLTPGRYIFPYMVHADHKDPAVLERYMKGPVGVLDVWGKANMGRNLALTFVYFLLIALMLAYVSWSALGALPTEARFLKAFQVVGAMAVMVFASSGQLNAIWFPRRTSMDFLDGVAFGLIAGLVFAFFWPSAGA